MMTALVRMLLLALVRLLIGANGIWQGCSPSRAQRIYYANHSSHLDTVVILAALPAELRAATRPVAAKDYWLRSAARRFLAIDCLGAVLVDRSGTRSGDSLEPLAEALTAGDSLIVFPEGTRGEGVIGSFKSGLYHLARRFPGVEIVPVLLENLHRIMPKGAGLLIPLICCARFGAPLALGPDEDKVGFLERARAAVLCLGHPRHVHAH